MAEEFHAGICGDNWWNISSRSVFGGTGGGSPCSMAVFDMMGSYGWPAADVVDMKPRSNFGTIETNSVSDSSMVFQDAQQQTDFMDSTLHMMEFGLSSSSASNWNQSFPCNNGTMLHDIQKDFSAGTEDSTVNAFKPISTDDFPVSSSAGCCTETCQGLSVSFPIVSSSPSYGYQTTLLNSLLNSEPQNSVYNNGSMAANYEMNSNGFSTSWMNTSLPKLQPSNIHYNNTQLCNVPTKVVNNLRPNLLPSAKANLLGSNFEDKNKRNSEQVRDVKKIANEPAPPMKRPRIETPCPLPTFKVRKEKLGDRITALQQLVSPFGKTDTASVLQEAIEYIKSLHDQVNTLSTPYVKNGPSYNQQQQGCKQIRGTEEREQDLRSRGLCLVPLSSTFPVASETNADFWTPTLGGPFM